LFFVLLYMRHYWVLQYSELAFDIPLQTAHDWIEYGQDILYLWAKPLIVWPSSEERKKYAVKMGKKFIVGVTDCTQFVVKSMVLYY
jgi:hypothetical protein